MVCDWRVFSLGPCGGLFLHLRHQGAPILAGPIKRRRKLWLRRSRQASFRQQSSCVCNQSLVLLPWSFLRLVGSAGKQKIDPVFDAVLGEQENNLIKLILCDPSLLRGRPEPCFQLVTMLHVVIQISPDHQRRVSTHCQATP